MTCTCPAPLTPHNTHVQQLTHAHHLTSLRTPPLHLNTQSGTATERQLLILDRNRDLHLLHVRKRTCIKLAAMVDSARWHDEAPMVAAVVDCKVAVWYHPGVVWTDRDLLDQTKFVRSDR